MDALDDNAIGGLLIDVFGGDDRRGHHLRHLRCQSAGGRARRLPAGALHRRPLPDLRQRPHDASQAQGRDQRRPLRTGRLEPTMIGL